LLDLGEQFLKVVLLVEAVSIHGIAVDLKLSAGFPVSQRVFANTQEFGGFSDLQIVLQ
jgi:hypothetical protein